MAPTHVAAATVTTGPGLATWVAPTFAAGLIAIVWAKIVCLNDIAVIGPKLGITRHQHDEEIQRSEQKLFD